MTSKQKRINRVIVHREKELDKRVVALGNARAEAQRVEHAVQREEERIALAAAEREALKERPMSAADWREANEWLESRQKTRAVAAQELERANLRVEAQKSHVLDARRALKGVELYETRLKQEEARAEDKADQRLQDDLARGRAGQKRSDA
jgi:flagellar export protein FliJ